MFKPRIPFFIDIASKIDKKNKYVKKIFLYVSFFKLKKILMVKCISKIKKKIYIKKHLLNY